MLNQVILLRRSLRYQGTKTFDTERRLVVKKKSDSTRFENLIFPHH